MLLTRQQPDKPTAAANDLCSIRAPMDVILNLGSTRPLLDAFLHLLSRLLWLHLAKLADHNFCFSLAAFLLSCAWIALSIFPPVSPLNAARQKTHCDRNMPCTSGISHRVRLRRPLPASLGICRPRLASLPPVLAFQAWRVQPSFREGRSQLPVIMSVPVPPAGFAVLVSRHLHQLFCLHFQ